MACSSMSPLTENVKRVGDILFSSCALIASFPLYLVIGILIKIKSKGPIFYSQERIGKRGIPFKIYKFRTMETNAEKDGIPQLSHLNDNRITKIGSILRKYRIDELPQFWNVLKGDMSIVGPRPEREYFINQIIKKAPYYALLYQVKPGITSMGMVKYGYASDIDGLIKRLRSD